METCRTRSVVVTGASSGLGRACALHLARMGYEVFAGVRSVADSNTLRDEAPQCLTPILLDVTQRDTISTAVLEVERSVNERGLSALVNNAGIVSIGPLELITVADFRRQFDVNVFGVVAVTQAFLPLLRKASGRIVNIGSASGFCALPFISAYAASKFALEAITDSMRIELHPWGIHVSIVDPGAIATPMFDKNLVALDSLERTMSMEDVARYGANLQALRKRVRESPQGAMSADAAARIVAKALTARHPKPRYLVGRGARMLMLLEHLPVRLRDWLLLKYLKSKRS
ncbi:MAG: SDR family oxidoreductase [Candidatus Krumholzibacteriia bacterium]